MKVVKTWGWLALLLVLFIVIGYVGFSPQPQAFPAYSAQSPSPTGIKAIYTYLNKELDTAVWAKTPNLLPKDQSNLLLIMIEPAMQMENDEWQKYESFIEQGNTILLLSDNPKGMFDIKTKSVKNQVAATARDKDGKAVKSTVNRFVRLKEAPEDQILINDNLGPVALKRSFGQGQLIVSVTPEWITNENIMKTDHLEQSIHLINEGSPSAVMFDEYIHGAQDGSSLAVYPKWFLLFMLQAALLAVLWLWSKGKRFGLIDVPREETVRFSDEGIRALAAWHIRTRSYHDSLVIQADYVKLLMQERWQIPFSREWQDLAGHLERKWKGIPAKEILSFLTGLTAMLEKEQLNKQEFLLWSRKLEQLRKEVES